MSNTTSSAPRPHIRQYGLGSSAFAHRYLRNRFFFLFLQVLRCFTSPGSLPCGWWRVAPSGFPIRTPTSYRMLTAPRGFSQLAASFFAYHCQGILYALLVAWPKLQLLYTPLSLYIYYWGGNASPYQLPTALTCRQIWNTASNLYKNSRTIISLWVIGSLFFTPNIYCQITKMKSKYIV